MRRLRLVLMTGAAALCTAALAQETVHYDYDARGRLGNVTRSGGVNNGLATSYTLDKADNRTSKAIGTAPPPPSFAIGNASVSEGGSLSFTVTKTGSTNRSFGVNYVTANGTATSADYQSISGTLVFTATETSKTIAVMSIEDTLFEANETFFINLSGATGGATISDAQGMGTIINDDSSNSGPTTVADSASGTTCQIGVIKDVVANDSDPEGNLPITLVDVTSGIYGSASVLDATRVNYQVGSAGTDVLTYTVQDSLGATSTGQLTVTISQC